MTPKEALQEITSQPKWYVVLDDDGNRDSVKESTLRVAALRILNGSAKQDAMQRFFEKFGYKLNFNITKDE
jgi:hypothetical protein